MVATAEQIAAALAGSAGSSSIRFRYEQRTRTNGLVADITSAVLGCEITLDNDRPIVRTARLRIDASVLPASFVAPGSYIAVWMDVLVNGTYEAFQCGLFRADIPEREYTPNIHDLTFVVHEIWTLAAADLTADLLDATVATTYTVPVGTGYIAAVRAILDTLELSHAFPGTADITPVAFTWPAGTSLYRICGDLLAGINWFPPWPSVAGVFTSRERTDPAAQAADVTLYTEQEPRMIRPPFRTSEDRARGPNQFTVVTQDPARTPLAAAMVNSDPSSAISIPALGFVIARQETIDRLVDVQRGRDYGSYELRTAAARSFAGSLGTNLDPRREAHESYRIFVTAITFGDLWRVNSWSMPCATGAVMRHTLGRARGVQIQSVSLTGTDVGVAYGGQLAASPPRRRDHSNARAVGVAQ